MWRLSIEDLWACGFPKFDRHNPQFGEPDIDVPDKNGKLCHINILERGLLSLRDSCSEELTHFVQIVASGILLILSSTHFARYYAAPKQENQVIK